MANFFTPAHMSPFHTKQSKQRKQERDLANLLRSKRRREAELEALEVARYDTWEYLDHFVKTSEWCQLKDQITICWETLPPLDELLSYGSLDKTSGTLKCRKLFKAAVIWEDLGCSLWAELSRSTPSNKPCPKQQHESSLATVHEQDLLVAGTTMPSLSHAASRSSRSSRGSRSPSRSRHASTDGGDSDRQSGTCSYSLRSPVRPPVRSHTMPEERDPLHGIPRFFTTSRSNSVKAL